MNTNSQEYQQSLVNQLMFERTITDNMERIPYAIYFRRLRSTQSRNPLVAMNCNMPEDIQGTKYFGSKYGISFVRPDGFMGGLCRTRPGGKSISEMHQRQRIKHGGYFLECYDGKLVKLYEKQGFKVVVRIPFNEEFAPEGWQQFLSHKPDVVFMSLYDLEPKTSKIYELAYEYASTKKLFRVFWSKQASDKLVKDFFNLDAALSACGKTRHDIRRINIKEETIYSVNDPMNFYIKEIPVKLNKS